MNIFTSHLKPGAQPVIVREGFSWGAALFGWLWLLLHRAWVPAALVFAAGLLVMRLTSITYSIVPFVTLLALQGIFGRDLWRWSLSLRGYQPGPPIAAENQDGALARLLMERSDLLADFAPGSRGINA